MKRFAVWNGVSINPAYQSVADIAAGIAALEPPGGWRLEWMPKAGEGGSWQAEWDRHPLALDGFGKLQQLVAQAAALARPLSILPYVVLRGKPEWREAEWQQIAEIAVATRRVCLNLEPGSDYWDGPTTRGQLLEEYIRPMWDRIRAAFGADPFWRRVWIEVATIPREWVIRALGGDDDVASTLDAWAESVQGMSWETYDESAPDLDVGDSMARVRAWLADTSRAPRRSFYVPIVQRSRIPVWARTEFAQGGVEVWHLDGD